MKYEVIMAFRDKNSNQRHDVGSTYETDDEKRAEHLQKLGYLGDEIKDADDDLDPRIEKLGGGFYLLPNGEKVRGKDNAIQALADLDNGSKDDQDE